MSFDEWVNANPDDTSNGPGLDPPPDGVYQVELQDAGAFIAKTSQKPMIKFELRVVSPQQRDFVWTVLLGFKSQTQANITKRQVRNLGIDVDSLASLEDVDAALKTKLGTFYAVEIKTNGEFRNTYVQEGGPTGSDIPIPSDAFATPDPAAAATPDDRVPF